MLEVEEKLLICSDLIALPIYTKERLGELQINVSISLMVSWSYYHHSGKNL